jgi:hypothetical protein
MLPGGHFFSLFLFVTFTYLLTLIDPTVLLELFVFFAVSLLVFIILSVKSLTNMFSILRKCYSIVIYFSGLFLFAKIAPTSHHWLSSVVYLSLLIVFSVLSFYLMTRPDEHRVSTQLDEESEAASINQPA